MSLVADYSSSSDSESNENDLTDRVSVPVAASSSSQGKKRAALPSAADLFSGDGNNPKSIYRGMHIPVSKKTKAASKDGAALKPSVQAKSLNTRTKNPSVPFMPPQLKKPNISTEDSSAWNTDATTRRMAKKTQSNSK